MGSNSISRLTGALQNAQESANNDLKKLADAQQSNIEQKQSLRSVESKFESMTKDSSSVGNAGAIAQNAGLKLKADAVAPEASIAKPAMYLDRFAKSGAAVSSLFSPSALAKSLNDVVSSAKGFAGGLNAFAEALKRKFEEANKDLENQDKLGNFEIQTLMSDFNQTQALANSTKKKMDDQSSSVLGKI